MAKALVGHLRGDQLIPTRLTLENQRLRGRVADLESLVLRLQRENDRLLLAEEPGVAEHAHAALEAEMMLA